MSDVSTMLRLDAGDRLRVPPGVALRLISGRANVAAVQFDGDTPNGPGLHIGGLAAGDLAVGLPGAGLPGAGLAIELSILESGIAINVPLNRIDAGALDRWLRAIEQLDANTPFTAPRALFPGRATLEAGEVVAAPRDRAIWVGDGRTLLTDTNPRAWPAAGEVEIATTAELAASGALDGALHTWIGATAERLASLAAREPARRAGNIVAAAGEVAEAAAAARASVSSAARRSVGHDQDVVARTVTRAAAALVGGDTDPLETARQTADQAGLGTRFVTLNQPLDGEEGPILLARLESGETVSRLVAALPRGRGYVIAGPDDGVVSRPGRMRLGARAVALTEPLPERLIAALDRPARLLAAVTTASPLDAVIALGWGIAGIAMAAAMPTAVNLLFSSIWPRADAAGHWLVILALAAIALNGIGFESARSMRTGRLVLRFASALENGAWLRLVRARPRGSISTGGDTLERFTTASHLRHLLSGQPMRFIIDLGMLAAGIGQMIWYGGHLAWIGAAAILLLGLVCAVLLPAATRTRTETEELGGKQTALLAQAIAAVTKVKATASENFVLARWAALADRRRTALRRAERIETVATLAAAAITGFATAAVFALAGYALGVDDAEAGLSPGTQAPAAYAITLGAFLAFQVALGQTMSAASSAASMTALWPALAAAGTRLRPLAELAPETTGQRSTPPPLEGAITVSHVTHRYPGCDTPALDDVGLTIAARGYVAIAGASGSGKSTLLRILLGLEQPDQGAVYFDGLDARQLDPAPLRRQIGYVGQDSRLAPGSILDNILDGRPVGPEPAWEAARLAGIADDIQAMPMGMRTLVGEGGQNISGGQRQRILIARAILSRPRILIFDEATSALDNRAQAVVQRGLAELPVTRIVVAHRLSTIREVDRVFVLSKGRLVESGSPAELMRLDGPFAALSGRQSWGDRVSGDPGGEQI